LLVNVSKCQQHDSELHKAQQAETRESLFVVNDDLKLRLTNAI